MAYHSLLDPKLPKFVSVFGPLLAQEYPAQVTSIPINTFFELARKIRLSALVATQFKASIMLCESAVGSGRIERSRRKAGEGNVYGDSRHPGRNCGND